LFPGGVDPTNLPLFLTGLDLLLEECDSLPLKYTARHHARARRLDVIYAGDERGFVSVEPYRRFPDHQAFHGLVPEAPGPRSAYPSSTAFMRALAQWLGGWEGISQRSRDSIARIGEELCGYPQLASEARFAAGQLGFLARRLLLGDQLPPSWRYVDLNELIPS
jgi:tRNA threonylcarbamoyladenosine dehydratase